MAIFSVPKIKSNAEVAAFDKVVRSVYNDFGFTEVAVKLALYVQKSGLVRMRFGIRPKMLYAQAISASGPVMGRVAGRRRILWTKDLSITLKIRLVVLGSVVPYRSIFRCRLVLSAEYVADDN
jgi:threonyl-tRNA synthetase